jgi:hypothetical protein
MREDGELIHVSQLWNRRGSVDHPRRRPLGMFGMYESLNGDVMVREMSEKQFRAAAARHGFTVTGLSLTDHELGVAYSFIYTIGPKGIQVHYREWLASAIQKRAQERKRRAKVAPPAD